MPRFIRRRKNLPPAEIRRRAEQQRVGVNAFEFHDPNFHIPGTKPEKIVYDELVSRGIPFRFQDYVHIYIKHFINKWYRPDFILPYDKIIIEVQGGFWHAKPATIKKDAYKIALYKLEGWKVLVWWDYEIENGVDNLFARDLNKTKRKVPSASAAWGRKHGRKRRDDSAGIKTLNRKRAQAWKKQARTKRYRKRKRYVPVTTFPVSSG